MITFMTRGQFGTSLADLDNARLHQQMETCMTLFDDLTGVTPLADQRHPVLGMWRGYEFALGIYAMMGNMVWSFDRAYASGQYLKFFYTAIKEMQSDDPEFSFELPPWWGDTAVMLSHRSLLLRTGRAEFTGKWKVCPTNWPTIWPQIDENHPDGYSLWISKAEKKMIATGERSRPDIAALERVVNWP